MPSTLSSASPPLMCMDGWGRVKVKVFSTSRPNHQAETVGIRDFIELAVSTLILSRWNSEKR